MMRRSTAEKMGGLDRRFRGVFWERDLILRLHVLGGIDFKTCDKVEVAEDMDHQGGLQRTGKRASREWGNHDLNVLNKLWKCHPNKVNSYFPAMRLSPGEYYSDDDLSIIIPE